MSRASVLRARLGLSKFDTSAPLRPVERHYHYHFPGIVFVLFTIVVALGAVNSQNNLLFLSLGLCLGALVISGVISGASLLGLRLQRTLEPQATSLRPLDIAYRVANTNRLFTSLGIMIEELLPSELRSRRPVGLAWWKFRLVTGQAAPGRAITPAAFVASIGPRQSVSVRARVTPLRRGWLSLPSLRVWTTFPFGLSRKSIRFNQASTVLVRPAVFDLKPGIIQGLLAHGPIGDQFSSRAGAGDEFFGIREYVPGDSPRQIAWRASARRASAGGPLVIRQTLAPAPPIFWIVLRLDHRASHASNERAIVLASSLLSAIAAARGAIGLIIQGGRLDLREQRASADTDDAVRVEPRGGAAHFGHLFTQLAMAHPAAEQVRPASTPRGGSIIAIHAGPIDTHAVQGATRHWSGDDLARLIDPARSANSLTLFERSFEPGEGAFA